nr:hypothetical protein [Tanacetum cinerariifolium]
MELYMMNIQHERMILESVENGPLIWPSIKENGVTRPKKYSELSATEVIQADYDVKATNTFFKESHLRDLHITNVDQLHAYLGQHEFHANEVRLMHEHNSDPLALVATYQMTQSPYQTHQHPYQHLRWEKSVTYPPNDFQLSVHHNVYNPSFIPQVEYAPLANQQPGFSQPDSGLIVPVFQKGDDLIDAINHMMSFLTAVGRHTSLAAGTSRTYTSEASGNNSRKQKTVVCYNYKREGHMSKQCSKPKRKRDESWFKDKVLLVQAQENVALMANLSHYGSDDLAEIHNQDNVTYNLINQAVQAMPLSEQSNIVNQSETKITSDSNIIPYSQYVSESQQAAV